MKKVFGYILIAIPVLLLFGGGVSSNGLLPTLILWAILFAFAGMIITGLSLIEKADDEDID